MTRFSSLSSLLDYLNVTDIKRDLFPFSEKASDYEWVDNGNGKGVILPNLNKFSSLFVYRGQTKRFQPCVSSLLRGEVTNIDIIVYKVKMAEFLALLDNPRTRLSEEIGLEVNLEALAQHYGLKTVHLDVSHSLDVAAFFACCSLEEGEWKPMSSGTGVVYRLPFIPDYTCDIVGPQIYPRPKQQFAESVRVDIEQDFESFPYVETFEFEHSYDESLYFFNKFNRGQSLFPFDLIAEKADLIVNDRELPISAIKRVLNADGVPENQWEEKIQYVASKLKAENKGSISNRSEHTFSEQELKALEQNLEHVKADILGNTGFRAVFAP